MKKQKNEELKFLYINENKEKKTPKKVKSKAKNKRAEKTKSAQEDIFNFDNEIVIGVTKIPDEAKKNIKKNKLNNKNKVKSKTNNKGQAKKSKQNTKKDEKSIIIKGIIKWTILLCALVASFVYFMMSPLFNLTTIEVVNNQKVSTDTIISLSELTIGDNIFKTSTKQIEKNIKQNAYIESAKTQIKLPNKLVITIVERETTFMLEYSSSYVYINNQGYILEISQEKLDIPIIDGYSTSQDEIKVSNRLNAEDLEKMETVLKIMDSASANNIAGKITRINIENKQNYYITLEEEKKIAYLGDASNLSNRMLYLKAILEEEKGVEGEVFINGDLNKTNVYFRSKEYL